MDYQAIQVEREKQALEAGVARYQAMVEREPTGNRKAQSLLMALVDAAAAGIKGWIDEAQRGGAVRGEKSADLAMEFDPRTLAYLTLKVAMAEGIKGPRPATAVAFKLAGLAAAQRQLDEVRCQEPKLYARLVKHLARHRDDYIIVTARRSTRWGNIKPVRWTVSERYQFGRTLLEIVGAATGFYSIEQRLAGRAKRSNGATGGASRTQDMIELAPLAVERLRKAHDAAALLAPVWGPMVCRPIPWTSLTRGGFLTTGLQVPAVKTLGRKLLAELETAVSPDVLTALNAVQDTAWAINDVVLEAARALWDGDQGLAGLPRKEGTPMPDSAGYGDSEEGIKALKLERAKRHHENNVTLSKRVGTEMALRCAEDLAQFPAVYFVHTLDFRGRLYPSSAYLSPQGNDLQRGLLTFAEAVPLGENGKRWLAIHGANSAGIDKAAFETRETWVYMNHARIVQAGTDPMADLWWTEAEAPFQFLAFCVEWAELDAYENAGGDHVEFESTLPVSFDGTCNGLQNFAGMLRDEVAGALVGLVPSATPSDIYRAVADKAADLMREEGGDMADKWEPVLRSKAGRKVTKRNTMTVPYSVSDYGMRSQLMGEIDEIVADYDGLPIEADFDDVKYLQKKNRAAIDTMVSSASRVMSYVRALATVTSAGGLPVSWMTPIGFPVMQRYMERADKELKVVVLGKRVWPSIRVTGEKLSRREQDLGVAPNFVHSMDASHLMKTVTIAINDGIDSFAMVHDSYGAHAGKADALRAALAQAFVWQYRDHDVLGAFRASIIASIPGNPELPPPPAPGSLDVEGVLDSPYFFA